MLLLGSLMTHLSIIKTGIKHVDMHAGFYNGFYLEWVHASLNWKMEYVCSAMGDYRLIGHAADLLAHGQMSKVGWMWWQDDWFEGV